MTFTAYTGIATDGPLNGQVRTARSNRLPQPGGFYIFVKPAGATPGSWRWIGNEKGTASGNQRTD